MSFLKRILTPPVFDNETKTQQAYMLHIILWTLVFVPVPYFIYALVATPEVLTRATIQSLFGLLTNSILLVILRRGYVRAAAIIQVSAFWLFFTATAITGKGVQGEAYLIGYTLVITIAGILLGGGGAFIFTAMSLGIGLYMVNLQLLGKLNGGFSGSPISTWVSSLLLFPVGAILQRLASGNVRHSLARARASEERYRLISQVSSDYTFSTALDSNGNMHLNWVAGAFEEITGYGFEEYVANGGWLGHLHPDDLNQDAKDMETLHQNQRVVTEIRTFTKTQEMRWVRAYAHPIWDAKQNRLSGIVGAVQDITEHKLVEQERENLIAELETKNAELERFTYTVSHDLKSPLVTITGFIGFLEQDAKNGYTEKVKGSIDRISAAATKMQALLSDLLELSRVGRLMNDPEDVPFEQIVNEAIDHVRGRLDEIDAIIETQTEYPIVHVDRIRLVESVQNLIDNAAKYSSKQNKPRIEIGVSGNDQNGLPIFYIRDNGIGIEKQYHDRIFGLFNKLNAQSEGTGIGLSLVKRIIEMHNGRIWVDSEKDKGATFYFTLPTPQTKE